SVRLLSRIVSGLGAANTVRDDLVPLAVLFLTISIVVIGLQFAGRLTAIRANGVMLGSLQQQLHDKLLAMPPAFHDQNDLGETTTIVMQDAIVCQPMLTELIAAPFTLGATLISALVFLLESLHDLHDVPAAAQLVLIAVLMVVPPIGWWLFHRLAHAFDAMRSAHSALGSEFANSAIAPNEVRLLGAARQRSRAFARRMSGLVTLRIRADTRLALSNQFQTAVPALLQAGFLTFAAMAATNDGAEAAGAILSIFYFVPKVIEPIDQLTRFFGSLQPLWAQAARIGKVLDTSPRRSASGGPPMEAAPDVTFDRVTFGYPGVPEPTLNDFSHVFPAGRITAVVGRSGTGKSSLLSLIDGLREPDSGTVKIAGRQVQSFDQEALCETIGVVSQFPLFIDDTVRANFQLGHDGATDAEIEAAARATGLWPALEKLGENPLDAIVPRTAGRGLSGGERRRLALTRVLLRRPKALLLDEPTTGVDQLSIGMLMEALRVACKGMTVIMVEHNLDVVSGLADVVCCMEGGKFSDVGRPDELANRPSLFRELLAARERLTSTVGMELHSVSLPRIGSGPAFDPWADQHDANSDAPANGEAMVPATSSAGAA
ncbi:MAG TPA: ABC transporter ATP-binding protein, partial [Acetobacteraceae bacterium]|nr:ABC transporter ATP-binding protein [Acetobacteraceae bacterium]